MKYINKDELYEAFLKGNIFGLDSEYSVTSRNLIYKFEAKGIDVNSWWVMTDCSWICPCCKRTKVNIVRLNQYNYLSGHLHEHHDHMPENLKVQFKKALELNGKRQTDIQLAKQFIERTAHMFSAFDPIIICADCNIADAAAKKYLNLPKYFSFSPLEISQFIEVKSNQVHQLNKALTNRIWKQCADAFEKRQELMFLLANLAVTNKHWYQSCKETARETKNKAESFMKKYGMHELGNAPFEQILYSKKKYNSNTTAWRYNKKIRQVLPPTEKQIKFYASYINIEQRWHQVKEDWTCQGCHRNKIECLRKSRRDKWTFSCNKVPMFLNFENSAFYSLCHDCINVTRLVGIEIRTINQRGYLQGSSMITIEELQSIIQVLPNTQHSINNEVMNDLLSIFTTRIERME